MVVWILATTVVVCYCAYFFFSMQRRFNFFKDLGIPYLPPVPIFGNMMQQVLLQEHISDLIKELYNLIPSAKYVGLYNFTKPVIVLRDPNLIKDVLVKNFEDFLDQKTCCNDANSISVRKSLFNLTGEKWQKCRNMLSAAFTSAKMKSMFEMVHDVAHNLVGSIADIAKDPKNVVNMGELMSKYSSDVITTYAFGVSVNSFNDSENDFYKYSKIFTRLGSIATVKYYLDRGFRRLAKALKICVFPDRMVKFFEEAVRSVTKTRDEQGITRSDMMQLIMDARIKSSENLNMDNSLITGLAFSFYYNGLKSVSTQICLLTHELAINPEVQMKLQAEIDEVASKLDERQLTYDDLSSMDYLDACVNESARLHSVVYIDRVCRKRFELPPALLGLDPLVVEPGMVIYVPIFGMHHDPKIFENPDKYEPERFLRSKARAVDNWSFGMGPRSCVGKRIAVFEIKMAIFRMLERYSLRTNAKTCVPLVYSTWSYSHEAVGGFWLTFEPRKK